MVLKWFCSLTYYSYAKNSVYQTNPVFQIFQEADLDDDKMLSYAEFEHVISKAPDFVKYVKMTLSISLYLADLALSTQVESFSIKIISLRLSHSQVFYPFGLLPLR